MNFSVCTKQTKDNSSKHCPQQQPGLLVLVSLHGELPLHLLALQKPWQRGQQNPVVSAISPRYYGVKRLSDVVSKAQHTYLAPLF